MMVTGIGLMNARGSNAGTTESHSNPEGALDHLSIRWPDDVDPGIGRHSGLLCDGDGAADQNAHQHSHKNRGIPHCVSPTAAGHTHACRCECYDTSHRSEGPAFAIQARLTNGRSIASRCHAPQAARELRPPGEPVSDLQVAALKRFSVGIRPWQCIATVLAVCDASGAPNANASQPDAVFGPCGICHSVGPNAAGGVGPPLNGIVGKRWATYATFAYSAGLVAGRESGRLWDEAALDAWIEKPRAVVPDTKMTFPGLADRKARQAIIGYLRRFDEAGQAQ